MRLVAQPSPYDRERAAAPPLDKRRAWLATLIGIAACALTGALVRRWAVPMAALGAAWAMSVGFVALLAQARPVTQGEMGERGALRGLSTLPEGYVAVTNARIPGYERIGDVDVAVIGPAGVVVVEVKNFLRPMVVSGDDWAAQGRHGMPGPVKSVSRQVGDLVRALTKRLRQEGIDAPVHGVIAMNGNAFIDIAQPPPYPLVAYDELARAVEALPPAGAAVPIEKIERLLCSAPTTT